MLLPDIGRYRYSGDSIPRFDFLFLPLVSRKHNAAAAAAAVTARNVIYLFSIPWYESRSTRNFPLSSGGLRDANNGP